MSRPRIHWGAAVALAYTLFASTTVGFVAFAMSHPVQLVSRDYYERSQAHDAHLAAVARAQALGGGLAIDLASGGDALMVAVPAVAAAGATGQITLYRPADASADRRVVLGLDSSGRQRVPLDGLATGRWLVRVEWTSLGLRYYAEEPVTIR